MRSRWLFAALLLSGAFVGSESFGAQGTTCFNYHARLRAARTPWHGAYYNTSFGSPVALVVPPNAELTTDYTWGVGATEVRRIDHQFQRPFPGYPGSGTGFLPTPNHPSHTQQFGVYPVRGPW